MAQFFALAALIFALYAAFAPALDPADRSAPAGAAKEPEETGERVIRITGAEATRLAALYVAEAKTAPDPAELRGVLADHARLRALAAEARRLGLDRADPVVERRLAQKLRRTLADPGVIAPPSDAVLAAWIAAHPERFRAPPRVSFDHVFFRGDGAEARMRQEAARTALAHAPDAWRDLGDSFMLGRQAGDLTLREVARRFGPDFAEALRDLPASAAWVGPVRSAFGAHLVRVTQTRLGGAPALAVIKARATEAWREEERRKRQAAAEAEVLSRYQIIIEPPDGPATAAISVDGLRSP
ncbi:MAG: peptidylprolyl isomerase [Pseudomonadota bacterium]